jgi:DNA-binding transcriptional MerR regulator/effector-binding domain-containing protein
MFGIGQFAQLAKVSVRTLRHYDEVGLLRPAHVDQSSGYRSYEAAQLPALNRIVALKDLGFTLAEITRLMESGVSNEQLVGMLRLRQAQAEQAADDERRRLLRVAARIHLLQGDPTMTDEQAAIVVKPLDALHVATASEPTDSFDDDFSPIFDRLYGRVFGELGRAGVQPAGPNVAFYEERADGRVDVFAAVPIADGAGLDPAVVTVRSLPAAARAATLIHRGSMATCSSSYETLLRWIDAAGEQASGYSREIYLDCAGDFDTWVTELQFILSD